MRTSKIAALVGILAGLAWVAAGVLSWGENGLTDDSTLVWWGGVGVFALASALVGFLCVTSSPGWLKAVVFLGAGALGGSIVSSVDTDLDEAPLMVLSGGAVLVLVGLIGLVARRGRRDEEPEAAKGGRRAAR